MNKKLIIGTALVLVGVIGVGVYGVQQAQAQEYAQAPSIVQEFSDRFGLDSDDVETALGDIREEHRAQRSVDREEMLQQAVEDGVITAEQRQMLLDHRTEMEAEREQRRAEREEWREQSGIDFDALREYGGGCGMGGKFGGHGGRGFKGF